MWKIKLVGFLTEAGNKVSLSTYQVVLSVGFQFLGSSQQDEYMGC